MNVSSTQWVSLAAIAPLFSCYPFNEVNCEGRTVQATITNVSPTNAAVAPFAVDDEITVSVLGELWLGNDEAAMHFVRQDELAVAFPSAWPLLAFGSQTACQGTDPCASFDYPGAWTIAPDDAEQYPNASAEFVEGSGKIFVYPDNQEIVMDVTFAD